MKVSTVVPIGVKGLSRKVRDTRLIGLTGFAQSGKDTFAAGLTGWTRVALADKVRQMVEAIDPWIPIEIGEQQGVPILGKKPVKVTKLFRLSELLAEKDKEFGTSQDDGYGREAWMQVKMIPEVRRLLQTTGTEGGRHTLYEEVWIDAALPLSGTYDHVVVTDVRFPNEAQRVQQLGGRVILIEHPERGPLNAHPSEQMILDIVPDIRIKNNGSIADLHEKAALFARNPE